VLILNHKNGQIEVRLEPINPDVVDRLRRPGWQSPDRLYALQQAVFDRYASEYDGDWAGLCGCRRRAAPTRA
jgi:hypothetical protein